MAECRKVIEGRAHLNSTRDNALVLKVDQWRVINVSVIMFLKKKLEHDLIWAHGTETSCILFFKFSFKKK